MQTRTRAVRSTVAAVFTRDISHKYSESLSDLSAFTGASECAIAERRHRVKLRSSSRFCVRAREWAGAKRKRHSNRSGEETIRIVGLAELPSANNGTALSSPSYCGASLCVPAICSSNNRPRWSLIVCRPVDDLYGHLRLSPVYVYRRIDYPHVNAKESSVYRSSTNVVCDPVPRRQTGVCV